MNINENRKKAIIKQEKMIKLYHCRSCIHRDFSGGFNKCRFLADCHDGKCKWYDLEFKKEIKTELDQDGLNEYFRIQDKCWI